MRLTDCFSPLAIIGFAALWLFALVGLALVPADVSVPVHWNIRGQPDLFAPGWLSVLLLPLVASAVAAITAAVYGFSPREAVENGRHVVRAGLAAAMGLLLIFQCAFILIGLGQSVDIPRLTALAIGGFLLLVGNSLPKSQPNHVGGIRVPWTMRDEDNWRITHRWTGRLMMASGVILLIGALTVINGPVLIVLGLLAVLVPVLAGIGISFALSRR